MIVIMTYEQAEQLKVGDLITYGSPEDQITRTIELIQKTLHTREGIYFTVIYCYKPTKNVSYLDCYLITETNCSFMELL